jgi:hypothetical protein
MSAYKTRTGSRASIPVSAESQQVVCGMCGRPSEETICPACADKIRAEALANTAGEAPNARSRPGRREGK